MAQRRLNAKISRSPTRQAAAKRSRKRASGAGVPAVHKSVEHPKVTHVSATWWVSLLMAIVVQVAAMATSYGAMSNRVDMIEQTLTETRKELAASRSLVTDLAVMKAELRAISDTLSRLEASIKKRP